MSKSLKLSSPWVNYHNAVKALFGEDKDVKIKFDENNLDLKLFVSGKKKADAISKLLPTGKTFGNVTLKITVIPENLEAIEKPADVFEAAFEGNPVLSDTVTISGVYENPVTYIVFDKRVVQYWNDNLGDPHGNRSTLYETLAEEVFDSSVSKACQYCTAL